MSFKDTVLMILNELVMKMRYKFMYPCFDLNTKSDAFKKQTNKQTPNSNMYCKSSRTGQFLIKTKCALI